MFSGFFARTLSRKTLKIVQALRDAISSAKGKIHGGHTAAEELSRILRIVKNILFLDGIDRAPASGCTYSEEDEEDCVGQLVEIASTTDFLLMLSDALTLMEFETRKDAVQVFGNLLRRVFIDERSATTLVKRHGEALVATLVRGYDDIDIALNCGAMLRECVRYEDMAAAVIRNASFWRFFDLVEVSEFDVAGDAFASFREILLRHAAVSVPFIEQNHDLFTSNFNKLLCSQNYFTRRQSLKLLSVLLIDRRFFAIMTKFIASRTNLILLMNLLLDQRSSIKYEAFHVFKIFVANPDKTAEVVYILKRNKKRLLWYLTRFLLDRQEYDVAFNEDRVLVLEEIRMLV